MSYDLAADFRNQQSWCEKLGSPFTAALVARAAQAIEAGEPPAAFFATRPDWRMEDVAPLRFAGALHWLALAGQAPELAREYPWERHDWDIERVWRAAEEAMARDPEFFAAFLSHPPQTNETRRAMALTPAFHVAAENGPVHAWELGASAGLNLRWDKFAYRTASWAWGDGPLVLETDWRGPAPPIRQNLHVASRAGCDANPLDIQDRGQRLRLKSYIWADQRDRLERFDAAVALALADDTRVDRADAGAWLEARVERGLQEGVTILYHSIAWQYFSAETKRRAEAAIARAAAEADARRRFTWVRFEMVDAGVGSAKCTIEMTSWPGGEHRILGEADPHVRWVAWR